MFVSIIPTKTRFSLLISLLTMPLFKEGYNKVIVIQLEGVDQVDFHLLWSRHVAFFLWLMLPVGLPLDQVVDFGWNLELGIP